jgi:putative transposase
LGFTPPSGDAVLDALRMGIKRKDEILARLAGIANSWDCHGVPGTITTDAGRAFRSERLIAASEGFSIHFKPLRRPWLKGRIESWFRSVERTLFETFSPTAFAERAAYNRPSADERPVLTIEEANWIVAKWIVDIHHQQIDPDLGCTPAQMWNSGLQEIPRLRTVTEDLLD